MPQFSYAAVDNDGNPVEGVLEAASAHTCVAALVEQGLRVSSVEPMEGRHGLHVKKGKLTWEDLNLLNEQLLAITKGGLPLAQSLMAVANDLKRRNLRDLVQRLRKDLERGASLSEAIERHGDAFPSMYRGIIRAGEQSSNLSGVLAHLCSYTARMVALKHGFIQVIAYPVLVFVAICAAIGFLMVAVVPVLAQFYQDFDATLPWPTRLLIFVSDGCVRHGREVLVGVAVTACAVALLLRVARRTLEGAYVIDWILLHAPVFGGRNYAAAVARFSRSLGMLLANQVPAPESIELAADAANNEVLARAARRAARSVDQGEPISDAFEKTGFFRGVYCWSLHHAEQTGDVESGLFSLADDCEEELAITDKTIVAMTEPVACILLGVMLGFVVVALYLPVYAVGSYVNP